MDKIPQFPEFAKWGIEHREAVEAYLKKYPPTVSEINYTEIFAWRPVRNTELASYKGNICISFEKNGKQYFAVPDGPYSIVETTRELLRHSRQNNREAQACFFTEETIKQFHGMEKEFIIETDRASSDYVYLSSDLIGLKGRKYDGKRNQIKQFMRNYTSELVPITADTMSAVVEFQKEWCRKRPCEPGTMLSDENVAIGQMIENFSKLSIFGAILEVNGNTGGYTFAGELNQNTTVVYIEKAFHEFKGVYQALNQMFAERYMAKYEFINREQDVGDDGLRHAKMSYHPHHLVHKYCVKLK